VTFISTVITVTMVITATSVTTLVIMLPIFAMLLFFAVTTIYVTIIVTIDVLVVPALHSISLWRRCVPAACCGSGDCLPAIIVNIPTIIIVVTMAMGVIAITMMVVPMAMTMMVLSPITGIGCITDNVACHSTNHCSCNSPFDRVARTGANDCTDATTKNCTSGGSLMLRRKYTAG